MTQRLCADCGQVPLRYNNRSGFCSKCYDRNRLRSQSGTPEWHERNAKVQEYYRKTRIERVHYQKFRKFGITLKQYNDMLRDQNYACAICERRIDELDEVLNIDHDHTCCPTTREQPKTCGECIRGLLCRMCNHGLGNFQDDIGLMNKAIHYLRSTHEYQVPVDPP